MQCQYCGVENLENAVFCKKCGRRLDGMAVCPSCKNLTPADGEFCINCGANRNAPLFPEIERTRGYKPKARTVYAYAESGENIIGSASSETSCGGRIDCGTGESLSADGTAAKSRIQSILEWVGEGCAAFAALIGMIFVFLIGYDVTLGQSIAASYKIEPQNIFYFFGGIYKDISEAFEGGTYNEFMQWSTSIGAAIGTICSAFAIIVTSVFFVLTVIRLVRRLMHKTEKSAMFLGCATGVAYVVGAILFLMCVNTNCIIEGSSGLETSKVVLSGATTAGLTLGLIGIIAAAACSLVVKFMHGNIINTIFKNAAVLVAAVLALIAFAVLAGQPLYVELDRSYFEQSYTSTLTSGLATFFIVFMTYFSGFYRPDDGATPYGDGFVSFFNGQLATNIIVLVLVAAFCVLVVIAVKPLFVNSKTDSGLLSGILVCAAGFCVLAAGIVCIVSNMSVVSWLTETLVADSLNSYIRYDVSAVTGGAIGAIVLGVLVAVCGVLHIVFGKIIARRNYAQA